MQFRMLGPLQMYDDRRRAATELTSPLQQRLLKALLAHPNTLVPASVLVRELWGGRPPQKAGNALQATPPGCAGPWSGRSPAARERPGSWPATRDTCCGWVPRSWTARVSASGCAGRGPWPGATPRKPVCCSVRR